MHEKRIDDYWNVGSIRSLSDSWKGFTKFILVKEKPPRDTIPAWQLEKVKCKKEVLLEAQRGKKKVHFASLMDICHLKNGIDTMEVRNPFTLPPGSTQAGHDSY